MPHNALKKAHPEFDPEYIQKKIGLIEKGLPIDISEEELTALEESLRGARSFYIDILAILTKNAEEDKTAALDPHFIEESKNLVGIELALRKVDDFRAHHWNKIKTV